MFVWLFVLTFIHINFCITNTYKLLDDENLQCVNDENKLKILRTIRKKLCTSVEKLARQVIELNYVNVEV